MIRIKAPRVWRLQRWNHEGITSEKSGASYFGETRMGAAPGRFYTEAMHRRVLALVRACDDDGRKPDSEYCRGVLVALAALRAQAEKEGKK